MAFSGRTLSNDMFDLCVTSERPWLEIVSRSLSNDMDIHMHAESLRFACDNVFGIFAGANLHDLNVLHVLSPSLIDLS